MTSPVTFLVLLVSMLAVTVGAVQSWHYFRSPSPDEFWVVSLQQAAIIERTASPPSRQRPDPLGANTVTAVLPFSLSRIHVLPVLCATWNGPVSVALYVPMMDDSVHLPHHPLHGASLDAVEQHMRDVVVGLPGRCSMHVVLAVEQLPPNQPALLDDDWYTIPINALRNIALHHADTEIVMLLDGDFIPGPPTLHAHLRHTVLPSLRAEMQQQGTMLVVPALDCEVPWEQGPDGLPTFPVSQHDAVMRRMFMFPNATEEATGKAAAAAALATGHVNVFQRDYHSNTDYEQWLTASEPYHVQGREGYEPYVIAFKSSLPRWDERFRGYFYNKIVYMFGLSEQDGRPYKVLPHAYILHLYHPRASLAEAGSKPAYFKLKDIYDNDVRLSIINKTYVAVAVEHGQALLGDLSR